MWRLISTWLGKGMEKTVLAAGAVAAFFTILWRAKNQGKLEERDRQERERREELNRQNEARLRAVRDAEEKRNEIAGLSDDELDARLRGDWSRRWTDNRPDL